GGGESPRLPAQGGAYPALPCAAIHDYPGDGVPLRGSAAFVGAGWHVMHVRGVVVVGVGRLAVFDRDAVSVQHGVNPDVVVRAAQDGGVPDGVTVAIGLVTD